ncbi:hypothetical protein [Methylobacter sp.]|uniref:hypothetical protein n=1 Tax=Methylobacter sp. TaxID=2051955 RepID=UPI0012180E04|nr:hypothetical protein [Methylobacter sp.]TAK59509.1 MAG: hypothetical protein EPO18_20320 [Methylobacter sp.]
MDLSKISPAYKDPVTGQVFTGETHAKINDVIGFDDGALKRRSLNSITAQDENTGFLDEGVFISRDEARARYGFWDSEGLIARRGS